MIYASPKRGTTIFGNCSGERLWRVCVNNLSQGAAAQ